MRNHAYTAALVLGALSLAAPMTAEAGPMSQSKLASTGMIEQAKTAIRNGNYAEAARILRPLAERDVLDHAIRSAGDVASAGVERALCLFAVVTDGFADELAAMPEDYVVQRRAGATVLFRRPGERCPWG